MRRSKSVAWNASDREKAENRKPGDTSRERGCDEDVRVQERI